MVEDKDGVGDRHGPEGGIRCLRPVDAGVEHHRPSHRHDGLDGSFGDAILVMGAYSSVGPNLGKGFELPGVVLCSETAAVVSVVSLGNDTHILATLLEGKFGMQSLVSVEMRLKDHIDVAAGVINKDASSAKHFLIFCLSFRRKQSTFRGANKVVHRHTLARKQVVVFEGTVTVENFGDCLSWC